jgi:hypothetical protein
MVCVCVSRGPKTENSSTLRPDDGRSVPNGTLRTQPEGRWVSSRGSEQHEQKQHRLTAARVASDAKQQPASMGSARRTPNACGGFDPTTAADTAKHQPPSPSTPSSQPEEETTHG